MTEKLKISYSDGSKVRKAVVEPIDASTGEGLNRDAAVIMADGIKSVPSPFAKARAKAWHETAAKALPRCAVGWELVQEKCLETAELVQLVVENPENRVPVITFNEELGEPVVSYQTERGSFLIRKAV